MSETTEWMDEKYQKVFEEECRGLERRRQNDPSCTLENLKGLLHHLYIWDGNNWDGRGEPMQIMLAATIAAYEQFIENWTKEREHDKTK